MPGQNCGFSYVYKSMIIILKMSLSKMAFIHLPIQLWTPKIECFSTTWMEFDWLHDISPPKDTYDNRKICIRSVLNMLGYAEQQFLRLKLECFWRTRSTQWLQMTWLLVSPGQQPCYWWRRFNKFWLPWGRISSVGAISVPGNCRRCKYILCFLEKNQHDKG